MVDDDQKDEVVNNPTLQETSEWYEQSSKRETTVLQLELTFFFLTGSAAGSVRIFGT